MALSQIREASQGPEPESAAVAEEQPVVKKEEVDGTKSPRSSISSKRIRGKRFNVSGYASILKVDALPVEHVMHLIAGGLKLWFYELPADVEKDECKVVRGCVEELESLISNISKMGSGTEFEDEVKKYVEVPDAFKTVCGAACASLQPKPSVAMVQTARRIITDASKAGGAFGKVTR